MDLALAAVCIILSAAGSGLGTLSGLVPGIHVNTLASVLLAS